MPNAVPLTLERTANGFAAAVYPAKTENAPYDWTLALFDEDGLRTGEIPLGRGIYGCQTATMPDGAIAALVSFTEEENPLDVDVRLVIVPQEDLL